METFLAMPVQIGDLVFFDDTTLYEWTPGNPIAAVPTNDGGGATTYYDSQITFSF